jgi:hypothetical protein
MIGVIVLVVSLVAIISAFFEVLTQKYFLTAGPIGTDDGAVTSGCGRLKCDGDFQLKADTANRTANVLFHRHEFNNKISFFYNFYQLIILSKLLESPKND